MYFMSKSITIYIESFTSIELKKELTINIHHLGEIPSMLSAMQNCTPIINIIFLEWLNSTSPIQLMKATLINVHRSGGIPIDQS